MARFESANESVRETGSDGDGGSAADDLRLVLWRAQGLGPLPGHLAQDEFKRSKGRQEPIMLPVIPNANVLRGVTERTQNGRNQARVGESSQCATGIFLAEARVWGAC